jgi:uncharacterized protein involved in type VI secretion and phage assembly
MDYHDFCLKTISRRKVTPYPSNFQLSENIRKDNIIHKFSQQQNIIISLITFYYYNFSKKSHIFDLHKFVIDRQKNHLR